MISDIIIKRKPYPVSTKTSVGKIAGRRYVWDVEYKQDGIVRHALFSTEEEARRYAITRLGYTG